MKVIVAENRDTGFKFLASCFEAARERCLGKPPVWRHYQQYGTRVWEDPSGKGWILKEETVFTLR